MRKLMWFVIGFAASCVTGICLLSGWWLLLLASFSLLAGIVLCFLGPCIYKICAYLLIGLSVGLAWFWVYDTAYISVARQRDGQTICTDILVSDYSYETDYGVGADGYLTLNNRKFSVRVYLDQQIELLPGDVVQGEFKLRLTVLGKEPMSSHYQGKGIFLLAYAVDGVNVEDSEEVPAQFLAANLRRGIIDLLSVLFPENTQGFVRALLLGDGTALTYEEDTAFKISGIRHIIAVSGLHVSILFALIYMLSGKHRLFTALLGIPLLILFAAVAGFTPSVVRACVMQILMILAMLTKKEYDPPSALAFAVLLILIVNPLSITSVGFQLSVGCMIGIFLFCRRISNYLVRIIHCHKGNSLRAKLGRWFCGSVSVTVSATVFTTPLSAYYFGTVSIIGVVTNLLTLWVVSFVFYGAILACAVGAVWPWAGRMIAYVIAPALRFVPLAAKMFSSFPMAAVYTCSIYIVIWLVCSYLLLISFLISRRKRPRTLMCCIVIGLMISLAASYVEPRLDAYRVTVLDVGQGQCILLQSGGSTYMVDCGGDSDKGAADVAAQQILSQGITHIDGLILTHYDRDHSGGVQYLLSRVRADTLYLPDCLDDSGTKDILAEKYAVCTRWVGTTMKIQTGNGLITLFSGEKEAGENESSLCVLFQPEGYDILITGDRNSPGERALLENTQVPELDLLVVGHHGSKSSTSFELLSETKPKAAVISVGRNNLFGHPNSEVLDRLHFFNCKVWRTDLHGTIIFRG